MQELWTSVDNYLETLFLERDPVLDAVIREQQEAGLPPIQVSPLEGKLLQIITRAMHAKQVLEIGTLGGYSAILLARALPENGKVITLEVDAQHAEVARRAFRRADVQHKVELRLGPALETLPTLHAEGHVFDVVFVDADKENNVHYAQWALKMSRAGTLIVVDNVVRDGDVINARSESPMTIGVRRMNEFVANEPRLAATVLQTVGSKGHDGMCFMIVK